MNRWPHYEQRKAAWVQAHPDATSEEYEQAARREFRGDKSRKARVAPEKRDLPAPAERSNLAGHEVQT